MVFPSVCSAWPPTPPIGSSATRHGQFPRCRSAAQLTIRRSFFRRRYWAWRRRRASACPRSQSNALPFLTPLTPPVAGFPEAASLPSSRSVRRSSRRRSGD
ncbi:hypothetical protein PVAP13_3NG180883 [Panicum virgatum]|uniref:Uncharacterized protein n=1 Tax=Panicum virgatum TaxID=38727 RepID=A0A8T0U5X9_PANVG|nr:hypothetical protein PVAP13_3NG180883 [Panicum virgatum]